MTISYRSGATATGLASVTINAPAGLIAGDVLIALIGTNGTPVTPSGWSQQQTGTTTGGVKFTAYSKVAGISEPSSYTFSPTLATLTDGLIDAFAEVSNVTPMDVAATVASALGGTVTWPSITTVTDVAWHLALVGDATSAVSVATPSNYTPRSSVVIVEDSSRQISPAGLISGVTATGATDWVAISIALRPAEAQANITVNLHLGELGGWR